MRLSWRNGCPGQVNIVEKIVFPDKKGSKPPLLRFIAVRKNFAQNGLQLSQIAGIGISCGGRSTAATALPFTAEPAGMGKRADCRNDRKASGNQSFCPERRERVAMAEWKYGAGKGYDNVVFFTFATGMGAGLIPRRTPLFGHVAIFAYEVGHLRLSGHGPVGFGKEGSFEGWQQWRRYCAGETDGSPTYPEMKPRPHIAAASTSCPP